MPTVKNSYCKPYEKNYHHVKVAGKVERSSTPTIFTPGFVARHDRGRIKEKEQNKTRRRRRKKRRKKLREVA